MHLHFFKALAFVVVVFAASAAAQCNCQGPNTACNLNSECCSNQCVNRGVPGFNRIRAMELEQSRINSDALHVRCSTWHISSVQPATLITEIEITSQPPESLLRPLGYSSIRRVEESWGVLINDQVLSRARTRVVDSLIIPKTEGKSIFAIGRKLSFVRDTQNLIRRRRFPESNLITITMFQLSLDSSRLGTSKDRHWLEHWTQTSQIFWIAPVWFGVVLVRSNQKTPRKKKLFLESLQEVGIVTRLQDLEVCWR
ncbi:hypothetical protein DFH08DRAFT_936668 [Mycena albidolilacea]|uniref:Uncharacterized protein n=1 Tax=Mycena albidolilacea TaxID=1033008 RepID=A0AAD7A2B4_9AGAR|nr:hypothetical protein DFH08DRAFT_936668 [Mycena albidolilacea]